MFNYIDSWLNYRFWIYERWGSGKPMETESIENIVMLRKDAERYRWLRARYGEGDETCLAEGILSEEQLDKYIDMKIA